MLTIGTLGSGIFIAPPNTKAAGAFVPAVARTAQLAELNKALDVAVETEQAGWLDCAVSAVGAVGGCVVASVIGCVGGSIMAACDCLPLVVEEFEPTIVRG